MTNDARDDALRDKHLLAALRHAPDRNVAPPAAVSAAILQQAQAAARGSAVHAAEPTARTAPSSAQRGGWWLGLKDGLNKLLRPAPAAAFGTLAVAGIVGLLWSTQEPPGVTDEVPLVAVPSSAQKPEPVTAAAPAPAPAPAEDSTAAALKQPASPPAVAAKGATPKRTPPVAPTPAPLAVQDAARNANQTAAVANDATAAKTSAPESRLLAQTTGAPAPAPAPVPAPAPTVSSMESAEPAAARADAAPTVARSAAAPPLRSSATASASGSTARQRSMADSAALQAASPSGESPMAAALSEMNAAGSGAQWTSPQGKTLAYTAAQQQWLADINRGTAGAWQRMPGIDAPPLANGAAWVLRQRDGAVCSLWLDGTNLWWRDARGQLFTAQAREDQVRGWIEAAKNW